MTVFTIKEKPMARCSARLGAAVALAGLALTTIPAGAATAAAAPQTNGGRCPRGALAARVAGRSLCLPAMRPAGSTAAGSAGSAGLSLIEGLEHQALLRAGRKAAHLSSVLTLGKPQEARLLGTLLAAAGNTSAAAAHDRQDHAAPDLPGGISIQPIPAAPGQMGSGTAVTLAPVTLKQGASSLTLSGTGQVLAQAEPCPAAGGDAPGHATLAIDLRARLQGPLGLSAQLEARLNVTAQLQGHVSADGKLSDYDADIRAEGTTSGAVKLLGVTVHNLNDSGSAHIVLAGITPGSSGNLAGLLGELGSPTHVVSVSLSGPGFTGADVTVDTMQGLGGIATLATALAADPAFARAQENWYDQAACLKAEFSPSSLDSVPPGSTNPVSLTVVSVQDSQPVTSAVSATALGGTVSPEQLTTGDSPQQLQLTVSGKPGDVTTLNVGGVSDRGRVLGSLAASTQKDLLITYTLTSAGNVDYPYTKGPFDSGTYSEQRDMALESSFALAPLAGSSGEAGSGTLSWTKSAFTSDQQDSGKATDGSTCTIEFQDAVTATTPATLDVKSLTVGSPDASGDPKVDLDMVIGNVAETLQVNESSLSGHCPVHDETDPSQIIASDLQDAHSQNGDTVTFPVQGSVEYRLTSGWKAGSGNVIATRTMTIQVPTSGAGVQGDPSTLVETVTISRQS